VYSRTLWKVSLGTVIVPGLLVPLVSSYFSRTRISALFGFVAMLSGWLTSTVWLLLGWSQQLGTSDRYPFGIEPMFPGVAVSVVVWVIGRMEMRKSLVHRE